MNETSGSASGGAQLISRTGTRLLSDGMPEEIQSAEGKLLYVYLAAAGESEIEEITDQLDVPRISAYSALGTLESRGVVEQVDAGTFQVA